MVFTNKYLIAIEFPTRKFLIKLTKLIALDHNNENENDINLLTVLKWFYPPVY